MSLIVVPHNYLPSIFKVYLPLPTIRINLSRKSLSSVEVKCSDELTKGLKWKSSSLSGT